MKQIHHIIFILLLRDYFFHPFIYIQNPYEGPERNINIIRVIILVERERERERDANEYEEQNISGALKLTDDATS